MLLLPCRVADDCSGVIGVSCLWRYRRYTVSIAGGRYEVDSNQAAFDVSKKRSKVAGFVAKLLRMVDSSNWICSSDDLETHRTVLNLAAEILVPTMVKNSRCIQPSKGRDVS